jgi:hypothetical protein
LLLIPVRRGRREKGYAGDVLRDSGDDVRDVRLLDDGHEGMSSLATPVVDVHDVGRTRDDRGVTSSATTPVVPEDVGT